jgi:Zn-dependent metalloprotease
MRAPTNTFIQDRLDKSDEAGMIYFKNSAKLREGELFGVYKTSSGLGTKDAMQLVKSETDQQGFTHNEYHQYYEGMRVEGGEAFEHSKSCYVAIVNGIIIEGLSLSTSPALTQSQALAAAIAYLNASKYAWEDPTWEQEIKDDTGNPNATYYPIGTLVLTNLPGAVLQASNYQLTWKFEILSLNPVQSRTVYVHAGNGSIVKSFDNQQDNGPAVTLYDGTQTIDTKWFGGLFHGHHHLESDDNEKKIRTRRGTSSTSGWGQLNHIFDLDDTWAADQAANTSAHWVVNQAWDYFRSTFGRKGMNGNSNEVRIFSGSSLGDNAVRFNQGGQEFIEFGTTAGLFGVTGTNLATLDVGGHEFTHGVTANEANLVFAGESGALNESFSDIFGTMTERFARGGTFNWTLAEDAGFVLRDMQTPAAGFLPQPATYLAGTFWFPVAGCMPANANDQCGVHTNSGVQNRWFFLLAQGGVQGGVTVQGIGAASAARIAYSNLCNFLGTNANHPAARVGAIAAARQIFGACSNEEIQTTNAWAAVGVGLPFAGGCVTLTGNPYICFDVASGAGVYTATGVPGATFTWTFPGAWSSYTTGTGNNTLVVTSVNTPPPPPYPIPVTISVTSSLGGTATFAVLLDKCRESRECKISERSEPPKENQQIIAKSPQDAVTLYPNPAKDMILLDSKGKTIRKITVYSSVGSLVAELLYSEENPIIDISGLQNGSYFLSLQLDQETIVKRFVKAN